MLVSIFASEKSKASEVTLTCSVPDACVHDIVRVTYLDLFDKCAIFVGQSQDNICYGSVLGPHKHFTFFLICTLFSVSLTLFLYNFTLLFCKICTFSLLNPLNPDGLASFQVGFKGCSTMQIPL